MTINRIYKAPLHNIFKLWAKIVVDANIFAYVFFAITRPSLATFDEILQVASGDYYLSTGHEKCWLSGYDAYFSFMISWTMDI